MKDYIKTKSVIILVVILGFIVLLNTYVKGKNDAKIIDLKYNNERINESTRRSNLNSCIDKAKTDRTNLWNSNCTKQSNGSCTIQNGNGTIEWIENRYKSDLENCYQLYKK